MTVPSGNINMSTVQADYNALHGGGAATTLSGLAGQYSLSTPTDLNAFKGRSLYTPMSLTLTPSRVLSSTVSVGTTTIAGSSTVSVSGGIGPFSYSWAFVSGASFTSVTGTTTATCHWSLTSHPISDITAVWSVTVTDSTGRTVTQNISVELDIENGS